MSKILKSPLNKMANGPEYDQYTLDEIIVQIVELNTAQAQFWQNAHGWAPKDAALLMSKSRLDRQISLSRCLKIWAKDNHLKSEEGALILAWANLGSLVEGTMKLFLCVHYESYKMDAVAEKDKTGNALCPDGLSLEKLHNFFKKKNFLTHDFMAFIKQVQTYRNTIHSFKNQPSGTADEYYKALRKYLEMIEEIDNTLPYPY